MREASATTRVVALLGDPVEHSLSPAFQNAAFAALGLNATYVALRCGLVHLPGLLAGIAHAGGAGNVTLPHKEAAARAIERPTDAVVSTGSCNTFWLENGLVYGDNTDVAGFRAAMHSLLGGSARGSRVLLLGAGGAARAAVYALTLEGAAELVILNRSSANAEDLVARFAGGGTELRTADTPQSLRGETFDLAVNATSLGLRSHDPLPIAPRSGIQVAAALDLVYHPDLTPWVRELHASGVPATDGLEMLVQQGAAAFTRWWGIDPPLEVMRAALPRR